jgi:uncharacterized protein with HEPN domain
MQKDERIYLAHMLDAALEAQGYLKDKTHDDFEADRGLRRQLERMIEIIGEAARLVPQPMRDACPHIPWSNIIGMRNRIVHDYLNVDSRILWDTMTRAIPTCSIARSHAAANRRILWDTMTRAIPTLIAELEKIVSPEMRAER